MAGRGKGLSPMDADDYESDFESTKSSNEDKGKRPLLERPRVAAIHWITDMDKKTAPRGKELSPMDADDAESDVEQITSSVIHKGKRALLEPPPRAAIYWIQCMKMAAKGKELSPMYAHDAEVEQTTSSNRPQVRFRINKGKYLLLKPPPIDADDNESDVELTTSSNVDKGKSPLLVPPPAWYTRAQVLSSQIWNDHASRLNEISRSQPALMDSLMLPSQTSNTSERQNSFLKLLTLHGLAPSFETLSCRPGSGPSKPTIIVAGENALQREQNRISFYNVLEIGKLEGILPCAARSLPGGMLSYMLVLDFGIEMEEVDEELLLEFMLLSGYTDEHGNMDMNVFCQWAWDFRIRESSNAYVGAELLGNFDGGPAGEFFRILAYGHQTGYTLRTIESAFRSLDFKITTYEAIVLLQDPWTFYQQIQEDTTKRYIIYLPHPTTREIILDKWVPLHRLMIFVACYMTLRVENPTGSESPATTEGEPSPE